MPLASEAGRDVFPANAQVERQAGIHFDVVLQEERRRSSCGSRIALARGPDAFARLNALDVAAAGGAQILGGAQAQEEIAEGLEGELAAGGARGRRASWTGSGRTAPPRRRVRAVDPGEGVGEESSTGCAVAKSLPEVPKMRKLPSGPRIAISGGWSKKRSAGVIPSDVADGVSSRGRPARTG